MSKQIYVEKHLFYFFKLPDELNYHGNSND